MADQRTNVVPFFKRLAMVEVLDSEIAKATVHALGVPKEFPQPFTISGSCEFIVSCGARLIASRVAEVVHPRYLSDARTAPPHAVITVGVLEPEFGQIEGLAAARARPLLV